MFQKILIANDGSPGAKKALRAAIDLAKRYGVDLYSISVEEDLPKYAATVGEVIEAQMKKSEYFRKINEEAKAEAAREGVVLHSDVLPGHEVGTIVTYVQERGFDLLVIGFMGHSSVFGRIWGSTSQNLTRLVPCTVMVVK